MRGQGSAEFLVVFCALLAVFLAFYLASTGHNAGLFQAKDSTGAMQEAYALSAAINYVHLAGPGASYNFTQRGGNVSIFGFSVVSSRDNAEGYAPLLNGDTNASSAGRGEIMISNSAGMIEIAE